MIENRASAMHRWPFFVVAAMLIALIGTFREAGWFSRATAEYLEGPIWLGLFLLMAKEFQRLPRTSQFLPAVYLCFSVCFLAEILLKLPIVQAFFAWKYLDPIINAGWAVTCLAVLWGLCISVRQAKTSEQLWRSMFDAAKDSVFVKDTSLRYTHVNPSMAKLFGGQQSLLGTTDASIMGSLSQQSAREDRDVLAGVSVDTEATIALNGQPRTFHIIKVPIRDEHEAVIGLTGIARDITKRRQVESQLELTQFSLDHAADLVLWVNQAGGVVYANEAARRLLGADRLAAGISELDEALSESSTWRKFWNHSDSVQSLQYETEFRIAAGDHVPVEVNAYRFCHDDHDHLCIIARDISMRKKLQAENQQRLADLSHLSRIQTAGEMVAGLAHELNQPLATVTNYSYTIAELLPDDADYLDEAQLSAIRQRIQVVHEEALRAGEIIRRLRSLIHKRNSPRVPTEMNALVESTLRLFESQWSDKCPVVKTLCAEPLYALVDGIQIQQIFLNLLSNARDSLREGTRAPVLHVTTGLRDSRIVIAFEDNGPGISGGMDDLFKPFISSKQDGMGLGLAICRSIAESHGGELTASNVASGGARFEVVLHQELPTCPESNHAVRVDSAATASAVNDHLPLQKSAYSRPDPKTA